jgi:inhibitor of KinA sporulation pathway (predicted exonuclease)
MFTLISIVSQSEVYYTDNSNRHNYCKKFPAITRIDVSIAYFFMCGFEKNLVFLREKEGRVEVIFEVPDK